MAEGTFAPQKPSKLPMNRMKTRSLRIESLESRQLFASLPFGATADDSAEYMLGRIAVTPVLLESNGQIDPNTENWTELQKSTVLANIETGLDWWTDLLRTKSNVHTLEFVIDRTFLDAPTPTPYEPISQRSNGYVDWVSRFLTDTGFSQSGQLETNIRAFNQSQRVKLGTDWSFTIFVVNSQNDSDGSFATGGSFDRAFAFAGGLFQIVPSTRPASTFTHETGHMFWARDEYIGGGNFTQRRGYYNAQNTNAIDFNPNPNFVQADSIMSSGASLDRAYQNLISPDSTLAQLGWVDSDSDGIFDVLDVPLKLEGLGRLNTQGTEYLFQGRASVQTLPNLNSSGQQNDISVNRVGRIEYRWNEGIWTTIASPNLSSTDINLVIPVPSGTTGRIQIRAVETTLPLTSNVFEGELGLTRDKPAVPGIQGFVWNDQNEDGDWQAIETAIANARVRLVDNNRQVLNLQRKIEPDNLTSGAVVGLQNGVTVDAIGEDAAGNVSVFEDASATTGSRVFRPFSFSQATYVDNFRGNQQQLRATMADPTSFVSIDVVAVNSGTVARLEAYSASGSLLRRFETPTLAAGQSATMRVVTDTNAIAYVIAKGMRNASIKLDNLAVGPSPVSTTGADGSYLFEGIATGSYQLEILPPSSQYDLVEPATGLRTAAFVAGSPSIHNDFALSLSIPPWQNPNIRHDVNNDGFVTALDVLAIINEINRNGARPLDGTTIVSPPFYDVDGNRSIEAFDVLAVINFINANLGSGEGEEASVEIPAVPLHDSFLHTNNFDPDIEKKLSRRR